MDNSVMTEQEFDQLVEKMRPRLMQMGREFFGSDTEAEEVVHETWLRAWNVRAIVNNIEGRVVVRFVVEKDGSLTHFSALNSPDESLSNGSWKMSGKPFVAINARRQHAIGAVVILWHGSHQRYP